MVINTGERFGRFAAAEPPGSYVLFSSIGMVIAARRPPAAAGFGGLASVAVGVASPPELCPLRWYSLHV